MLLSLALFTACSMLCLCVGPPACDTAIISSSSRVRLLDRLGDDACATARCQRDGAWQIGRGHGVRWCTAKVPIAMRGFVFWRDVQEAVIAQRLNYLKATP